MFIGSFDADPIELSSGQLLKDLYYYFASMTIYIPPLKVCKILQQQKNREQIITCPLFFTVQIVQSSAEVFLLMI